MSNTLRKFLSLVASLWLVSASGFASVITFDNLPAEGGVIPDGYAQLNWFNFDYINAMESAIGSADREGMVSAPFVAYSALGASSPSFTSTHPFTLVGGWFTSDSSNDMPLQVTGLLNGVAKDSVSLALNSNEPVHVMFNWSGIDQVEFSFARTPGAGFILDNLTITSVSPQTPEPASLLLLGSGLAMGIASWRRRG